MGTGFSKSHRGAATSIGRKGQSVQYEIDSNIRRRL